MASKLSSIIDELPRIREDIQDVKEIVVANAVMFGEIPGFTGEESERVRFLLDRFNECGCQSICTDEGGNGMAMLPGTEGKSSILLSAHLDTPFTKAVDHTISVQPNHLMGPGILDNSVGVAAIASLPNILSHLGIELKNDLLLMGSAKSLGRGNIEGIRFFLENNKRPLKAGIIVEGGSLGRMSYESFGMLRGVIECTMPETGYDYEKFGTGGAIPILNKAITKILNIPIPSEPKTSIIFGAIGGGTAYNSSATRAYLKFEIRSEQSGMVTQIRNEIEGILEEISFSSGVDLKLEPVASRKNGGIAFDHPLVSTVRKLMSAQKIKPRISPSTGEIAALIDSGVPSLTLGLTKGSKRHEFDESAQIDTIWTGLAQLIGVLKAIDEGICDEQN